MAIDKSTYDKLGEQEKKDLAKDYAKRLLHALTQEGSLGGGVGTNESVVKDIALELQRIGHDDLVNLIDTEVRKQHPEGLRQVLIDDYSGDSEDAILNAFGYPTDDLYGTSLQENATDDPSRSDYKKFLYGGSVKSNEYDESKAILAEDRGAETIAPRYTETDSEGPDIKKPETLDNLGLPTPAPAPGQAARPTLDQPGQGTAAAALAAAQAMPEGRAKDQMMHEYSRRMQKEIKELKKVEQSKKRAGEVDDILNTKNDQYRKLYEDSSPDRSAEDWDAMSRDQKIKLIKNYNTNRSLGAPAGEITGQKISALDSPRGSLEDITIPREFNNVSKEFEIPQEPREFDSRRNTFRTPDEISASRVPKLEAESFEPQVRPPERPNIDLDSIHEQVNSDAAEAKRLRRRQKPEIPADAVHTKHPNVPSDSHSGIYATNPGVHERAFDIQLDNAVKSTIPYENNIDDPKSTKVTPPPGVTAPGQAPQKSLQSLLDDPVYQQNVAKRNAAPQKSLQSLLDDPVYQQNVAKRNKLPAPQAPAPAAKLPPADPFIQDKPAEMQGPKEKMVPIYGRDGIIGYRPYSQQRIASKEYAKKQMRESPFSSLGHTNNDRMSKLYPTLNTDQLKNEVDQETADYYSKNNPFGEEYRPSAREPIGVAANSQTPRTDKMMRDINAMPKKQQLDVINSFRRHRGEDEIYNPFA